jgi:hypothetical protein
MADTPQDPEFYITEEGGLYHKWSPHIRGIVVHSLFFPDGSVWDSYVGWDQLDIEIVRERYRLAQERVGTMSV